MIFVPAACKIWFRMPNVPWFPSHKNSMFLTTHTKILTFLGWKKSSTEERQLSASYEQEGIDTGEKGV